MWGHTALIIQLTAPKIFRQHLSIVLIGIVVHIMVNVDKVILWRALSGESTQSIRSLVGTLCLCSASLICIFREIKIFVEPTKFDIWTSLRSFRFKFFLFFFNSHQTHLESVFLTNEIFGISRSLWLFLTSVSRRRRWVPLLFTSLFTACISFRLDMADKLFNFWDRLLKIVYLFEVWSYLFIFLAPDYSHERT